MASKTEYKKYILKATYFKGNKKYGRTTTIIEKSTSRKLVLMGIATKTEAIKAFKKHIGD